MKKRVFIFCMVCILLSSFLPADSVKGYIIYDIWNEQGSNPVTGVDHAIPVLNYRMFSKSPFRAIWWCNYGVYDPMNKDSIDYRDRKLTYTITIKNTGKNEIKELGFCLNTLANGNEGACPYAYHLKKSGFSDDIRTDNRHRRAVMEKGSIKVGEKKVIQFSYGVEKNALGMAVPSTPNKKYPILMYIPKLADSKVYQPGDEITILRYRVTPGWYVLDKIRGCIIHREKHLYVGQTKKLKILKGLGKLKWKSKNKKVATVSQKGKITAKKPGWITINVTGYQVKDEYNNWVEKPCFKKKKVVINRGRRKRLKLNAGSGKKKYKSSNPAIATVSSKGVVRGRRKGRTVITAKYRGYKMKCRVTVK